MKGQLRAHLVRVLSFALAFALLFLSACGSTSNTNESAGTPASSDANVSSDANTGSDAAADSDTEAAADGEVLAAEQVLNMTYTELERLDVNDVRNQNEEQILEEVQEGLFRTFTDEDGVEYNEYAGCTSYDLSDDGLTYTFHLREESVWSDGEPVTAQDYVDSWLRVIDPEGTFPAASSLFTIAGAEEYYNGEGSIDDVAVEALDDYTLQVTLDAPDLTFLKVINSVCFYPIRKDLIDAAEAAGKDWSTDYTLHVFNGPFIISDRVLENSMTLTKNETYWDADNIILTQVNFRVIDEASTKAQMMESQQLDIISAPSLEYIEQWQPLVDDGTFVHVATDSPVTYMLILDQHADGNGGLSGLMQNAKVRLALSLAIDREEFIELFENGYNTPAYGLIPGGMTVGETDFRSVVTEPLLADEYQAIASDPDALKALFEEGARETGYTGDIADLTISTLKFDPTTDETNMLEWFKQQIESKLGCQAELVIYPDLSGEQTAKKTYQWDYYEQGWGYGYNDPISALENFTSTSSYSSLMGGFVNEEFDSLIDQARSSTDNDERLELLAQAENILITEAGIAPLFYSQRHVYYQSYVKNLSLPIFNAPYEFSRSYILEH